MLDLARTVFASYGEMMVPLDKTEVNLKKVITLVLSLRANGLRAIFLTYNLLLSKIKPVNLLPMADFGKSLGNIVLAAAATLAPVQSNAADVSKLPEAVVAKCKADAMGELAGLKAKMDAAAPTATKELNMQRAERYTSLVQSAVDKCMELVVIKDRSAQLDVRSAQLDVTMQGLQEMDRELVQQLAFFDDFMAGKKSRAEYNTQIASLPAFVQRTSAAIADARKAFANRPDELAAYDRIENNMRKVMAFAANTQQPSGFQKVSFAN